MSEGPAPELPEDDWHSHVYVHFSWLECAVCNLEPELEWAWDGVSSGEQGVVEFSIRAVNHLKDARWQILDGGIYCPTCAASLFPNI